MNLIECLKGIKIKTLIKLLLLLCVLYFIVLKVFFNDYEIFILIWWTPFMPKGDRVINCNPTGYKCVITNDRNYLLSTKLGGILFYGSKIENFDFPIPRNFQIPWAIFHEESPKNYAPFLHADVQNIFNITSTFSQNSDFPVTVQYLTNIADLTDKKYFILTQTKNKLLQYISPVLYVQSDCDTPIGRDFIVKELCQYINIDSYGSCLNNKTFPTSLKEIHPLDVYNEKYMQFVSQYKFVISIENAVCEDYVTEKFWRPLIVGTVPIYLGATNIERLLPNNNSAILVKNYANLSALAKFIKKVNEDDVLYDSFLEHKLFSRVENMFLMNHYSDKESDYDHPIPEFECNVCNAVHKKIRKSHVNRDNVYICPKPIVKENEKNTWDQHWDIGKCQAKALKLLTEKNKRFTEKMFEGTWKYFHSKRDC